MVSVMMAGRVLSSRRAFSALTVPIADQERQVHVVAQTISSPSAVAVAYSRVTVTAMMADQVRSLQNGMSCHSHLPRHICRPEIKSSLSRTGSKFDSCSLGSDCADCGSRDRPCNDEDEDEDSYEEDDEVSSPPPPQACIGGRKMCDMTVCSIKMPMEMCHLCKCSTCAFCMAPKGVAAGAPFPKPPSRPSPSPPPPWKFSCGLLDGRQNARSGSRPQWCYTLSPSMCDKSFTYDMHSSGKPLLSICSIVNNHCEPMFVPEELYVTRCPLQLPPSSPRAPPRAPRPPFNPFPVRSPPRPSTPEARPCIPLVGKCGGDGPERLWECCQHESYGGIAQCFKKDEEHSQCRTECVDGWACDLGKKSQGHSHAPAPHQNKEPLKSSKIEDRVSTAHIETPLATTFTLSSSLPDPCKSCRVVDPSGIGEWRVVSSPKFGNGCFTFKSASAIFEANNGSWPWVPEYTLKQIPAEMRAYPSRCFQLPEGFECFKSPGRDCSSTGQQATDFGGASEDYPSDLLSLSTPYLSFSTHLPPSILALASFAIILCLCITCIATSRGSRNSGVTHEKIPAEEPNEGDVDGVDDGDADDLVIPNFLMSHKVVSL